MLNTVYQLKRPRQFEAVFKRIVLDESSVLVRPTYLSICNADQRYYQGKRNKKVLIKGVNGIGKTTLLKTLLGKINPISGKREVDYNIHYAYYEQEQEFEYITAIDYVWQFYPHLTNKEVRGLLAGVGINKDKAESLMPVLSGGEKARVRLGVLGNEETNTLILDEPTNHLDALAKEALKEALKEYKGTIVLVCHEKEFYDGLVDEIINLEDYSTKIV